MRTGLAYRLIEVDGKGRSTAAHEAVVAAAVLYETGPQLASLQSALPFGA